MRVEGGGWGVVEGRGVARCSKAEGVVALVGGRWRCRRVGQGRRGCAGGLHS